jgi:hypothetical protein
MGSPGRRVSGSAFLGTGSGDRIRKEAVMSEPAYTNEPDRPARPSFAERSAPARPAETEHTHEPMDRSRPFPVAPVKQLTAGRGLLRALVTMIGVAGVVVSAFLGWVNQTDAIRLSDRVFFATTFGTTSRFIASAGFVAIVIGLLTLLGLTSTNGWPTRLGGALGIAAFILVLITLGRSTTFSLPQDIGPGLWLLLAGSLVCVVAGFVPTTKVVGRRDVGIAPV